MNLKTHALLPVLLYILAGCDQSPQINSLNSVMKELVQELNNSSTINRGVTAEIVGKDLRIVYYLNDITAESVDKNELKRRLKSEMIKVSCNENLGMKSILVAGRKVDYAFYLKNNIALGSFELSREICANPNNLADFVQ